MVLPSLSWQTVLMMIMIEGRRLLSLLFSHLLSEIDKVLGHEAGLATLHNPDLPPKSVTSQS
eukprot:COSAG06_NODE_1693_length_8701_cov_80.626133_4_plen_62_part_00